MPAHLTSGGAGVSGTDLVMIVDTESSADGWVARSTGCVQDGDHFDVPIIGGLSINTQNWSWSDSIEDQHLVIVHEIAHTLAFTIDKAYYESWRDSTGTIYPNYPNTTDRMVLMDMLINGVNTKYIVTPKVIEKARLHFGCNTLSGLELEM
jgi:hypothetical protein